MECSSVGSGVPWRADNRRIHSSSRSAGSAPVDSLVRRRRFSVEFARTRSGQWEHGERGVPDVGGRYSGDDRPCLHFPDKLAVAETIPELGSQAGQRPMHRLGRRAHS